MKARRKRRLTWRGKQVNSSGIFSFFKRDDLEEDAPVFEDHFELDEMIGQGAFGRIWKGYKISEETEVKVPYAIKEISKDLMKLNDFEMVEEEIAALSQLRHPFIIGFKANFESSEYFHIVMEFVIGGNLRDFLEDEGRMEEKQAQHCFKQIFIALEHCALKGVVHRDIKPSNILITGDINNDPLIKLIDFGLSAVVDLKIHKKEDKTLDDWVGSLFYVSPEIIAKEKYNFKTDVWSVAVVLFEMLSGRKPFLLDRSRPGGRDRLMKSILIGSISFEEGFDNVSSEPQTFLSSLFVVDPNERLTPTEILELDWMKEKEVEKRTLTKRILMNMDESKLTTSMKAKKSALVKFQQVVWKSNTLLKFQDDSLDEEETATEVINYDNLKDTDLIKSRTFGNINI